MTDVLVSRSDSEAAGQTRRADSWALVADLARIQGIRMLRHPILLVAVGWYVADLLRRQPGRQLGPSLRR